MNTIVSQVTVVSFDGDGTLWDFEEAMRAALDDAATSLQSAGRPAVTADWLRAIRDEVAARPEFLRASMASIRREAFTEAVRRSGDDDVALAERLFDDYMVARFARLRLYDDVAAVLTALRASHRLALTTNGNTVPERVGLDGVFDVVTAAFDCGFHKPDPRIYLHTAERLGVNPEQVLHVGDHPAEDVVAARAAGMRTCWIRRASETWPGGQPADLIVTELTGLL